MKTSTYTRFRRLAHSAAHSAALVLAAALLVTACTDPADPADGSPASTDALSFGASLLAPGNSGKHTADTRTRATAPVTKDAFTKGDRIAVSIDNQVKPYDYGTDLRFTATDPDNSFYWTPGQQQQDGVIAWYPYSDELPSLSSPLNISRQDTDAAFAAADFLFAGPTTLTRNPSSALTFSHRTALLRLNIKADGKTVVPSQGFDVTGVDVKGTPVDATIDPTNGTLTGTGNTAVIYTHRCAATPDGYTATYEAQIIPHTISSSGGTTLTIHTTNPDKAYNGIILSGSYEAEHIHTYNITLGNDRVSITPTNKDLSWNDGDIRPGLPPTGYDLTVSTAKELKDFADAVNNDHTIGTSSVKARSARVLQTADIDLTGIDDWTPIGNNVSPSYNYFQGSYNGNGYTISNLKIKSGERYRGLFGWVNGESSSTPAVLTGIHLRNVDIDVSHNSNIFCGAIAGAVSDAVITFCSAQGEIKTDMNLQRLANNDSGGITGKNSGTISYCRADVKVTAFSDSNDAGTECNAGGISGRNNGTILACEASGSEVSAKASSAKTRAGGIAGIAYGDSYTASCASGVGKIIANSGGPEAYAGGVVGLQADVLYSSYARGDATAESTSTNMAGAIVGKNNFSDTDLCIGTGAGAGTGGQGTSNLPPSPGSILYDADATDEEIYNLMQSKDFEKQDIPTTTYDATCFPAYGIEVTKVTFSSKGAWSYDPASGKIRIRGLPSVPLP